MAFQSNPGLITNPNNNYFSFQSRKYNEGKLPNPSEILYSSSKIYVIDSRERDRSLYPNPSNYSLRFPTPFKNVTSIELKGSIIPKVEYNVNPENNKIPFNVEDFITDIKINNSGFGYVDGTYGFGAVPPNDTLVGISEPAITGGTNATITVVVVNSKIDSITIVNPGSGYLRGHYGSNFDFAQEGFYSNASASFINNIPFDNTIDTHINADINVTVGHELVATLTPGMYDMAHPNDLENGLLREVTTALQNATQEAIDDGILTPVVGGPQTGAEYFPYSVLDSNDGSAFLYTPNANASENSNVAIQRGADDGTYTQSLFLELLWGKSTYQDSNAQTLLGYGSADLKTLPFSPLDQTSGTLGDLVPWVSTPINGRFNYNLVDFPHYIILSIGNSPSDSAERMDSTNDVIDKGFATLIYDANNSIAVYRSPSNTPVDGEGNSDYNTLLAKPQCLKAIKGQDMDAKVLNFGLTPMSELKGISLQFKYFNGQFVDFKGADHLLIFQINSDNINSKNRL